MIYSYRVIFEPEENGTYRAWCPTLRAHSFGRTLDETKVNIQEAIECAIESLLKHNEWVPQDRLEEQIQVPMIVTLKQVSPRYSRRSTQYA